MTALAFSRRPFGPRAVGLGSLVLFFATVEVLIRVGVINRFIVPPPSEIIASFERVIVDDPTYALKHAVKGMLPKSRLGKRMLTHLLLYKGNEHPHLAQKPKVLSLKDKKDKK